MDKKRVKSELNFTFSWLWLCLMLMSLVIGSACSEETAEPSSVAVTSKEQKTKKVVISPSGGGVIKPGLLSEDIQKELGLDSPASIGHGGASWYLEEKSQSERCLSSTTCKQSGLCAQVSLKKKKAVIALDTKCIALSRQLCLGSKDCRHQGSCTPDRGRCIAQSDLDCFQSQRCKSYGLCHINDDRCIALSDQDCQSSTACKDFQACSHLAGLCVNQADMVKECAYGCVKVESGCFCHPDPPIVTLKSGFEPACLTQCQKSGGCVLGERGCTPRTQEDCEGSELCKTGGLCGYTKGRCVTTDRGCATSLQCSLAGLCSLHSGRCVARSEEDCLSSRGCAEQEMCQFEDERSSHAKGESKLSRLKPSEQGISHKERLGQCVRAKQPVDCTDKCSRLGQCEALDGVCFATSTARCRASEVCKKYGHCTPKNGRCIAKWVSDCKRSLNCKQLGQCTPTKGRCRK